MIPPYIRYALTVGNNHRAPANKTSGMHACKNTNAISLAQGVSWLVSIKATL